MKTRISLNRLWLAVVALATVCAGAPLCASSAFHGQILMEYVGQVINGTPTPASSNQFGNLHGVAGVDPSLQFTCKPEATTSRPLPTDRCGLWTERVRRRFIWPPRQAISVIRIRSAQACLYKFQPCGSK